MSKRKSGKKSSLSEERQGRQGLERPELAERLERVAAGLVVALLVVSVLITTDSIPHLGTSLAVVLLWVFAFCAWLLAGVLRSSMAVRFRAADAAAVVLLLIHVVSAAVMIWGEAGNARAAINMTWRWTSLVMAYFLIRQTVRTPLQTRAICAVMITLAVGISSFGVFQAIYVNPARKAEYNHVATQRPNETLQQTEKRVQVWFENYGLPYHPLGSPERRHVVDRIIALEPTGTFALTNSLGAFLTPWILLAAAIVFSTLNRAELRQRTIVAGIFVFVVVALCLLFTKSRTSWIAVLFGAGLLAIYFWRYGLRLGWKIPAIAVASIAGLVVLVVVAGGIDVQVVSETFKSLSYRLEYWQSTWQMIGDRPWLGCGPGNFKENYTLYKLPQASESIGDPHNFVFEVWSTAGTLGMLSLVTVLGLVCFPMLRAQFRATTEEPQGDGKQTVSNLYLGAAVGVLLAFPTGLLIGGIPSLAVLVVGVPAGIACLVLLHPWVVNGQLITPGLAIGFAALSVNLLGAGGISFLGVATTWWVLLALIMNQCEAAGDERQVSRPLVIGLLVLGLGLAFACQQTALFPMIHSQRLVFDGELLQASGKLVAAEDTLALAAEADRYSPEPMKRLATIALQQWFRSGGKSNETFHRFEQYADQLRRLDPKNHVTRSFIGDLYLQAHLVTGDAKPLPRAIAAYRVATQLYPASNVLHAQLAWALKLAGDLAAARWSAIQAMELDAQNPHLEMRLKHRRIFWGTDVKNTENTEQLMIELRSFNGAK